MSLYSKIFDLQQEIGPIKKTEENPFFKSSYFDINMLIDDLKPLLKKHGLTALQPLSNLNGKPALRTIVADKDTAEAIEDITPLPENIDPQKAGGGITYFRRYALTSFFLLGAEDDDGNDASGKVSTTQYKPATKAPVASQAIKPGPNDDPLTGERICIDCKKSFVPRAANATRCLDCYKISNPR